MGDKRGLWRIDSGVEAAQRLCDEKNTALFAKLNIMTEEETMARAEVMHDQYAGTVEIEALCMIDMINGHVLPSCLKSKVDSSKIASGVAKLKSKLHEMESASPSYEKAKVARVLRLEVMEEVRKACDEAEGLVPAADWTIGTYKELLFLNFNQGAKM